MRSIADILEKNDRDRIERNKNTPWDDWFDDAFSPPGGAQAPAGFQLVTINGQFVTVNGRNVIVPLHG